MSVKEILDKYYFRDHELLKHALIAKAEEDKKLTAKDTLKIEQARIYLKQLDIELMKNNGPPPIMTPISITPSRKQHGINRIRLHALPKILMQSRYQQDNFTSYLMSPQSSTTLRPFTTK